MMTFHVEDTVHMQITIGGSGSGGGDGGRVIATNYVTVHTASVTGTVCDLEEVPE